MNRRAKIEHITPEARVERAKRTIAEGVVELVEATLERGAAASDFYDQMTSPLGRERHNALARSGVFPSAKKMGRRWLVSRGDVNAYLDREGMRPKRSEAVDEIVEVVDELLAGGARRR